MVQALEYLFGAGLEGTLMEAIAEKDNDALHRLICAWESSDFSFKDLKKYYGFPSDGKYDFEAMRGLPNQREFTFDPKGKFFAKHGGRVGDLKDSHFGRLDRLILPGQPDRNLVSIVVGRLPPYQRRHIVVSNKLTWRGFRNKSEISDEKIGDSVYVYIESGKKRTPAFNLDIIGNSILSESLPILYAARTDNVSEGFNERILIMVPMLHQYY